LAANVLLGVNQALAWSMTVNMMIDLAPPNRRGFAAGINEFAGYLGVSLIAFLTGLVASTLSLRPEPFYIGIGVAVLGLMLSLFALETAPGGTPTPQGWVSGVGVPSVLGCATNLKDGLVWLSLPILLSARGMSLVEIGTVAGLYPLVWALGQPFFGPLSDRIGRKPLLAVGMGLQGFGLVVLSVSGTFPLTILAALILGLGTAMVYPTLIAAVADRVPEAQRATALGIYRFFRDGGYAVGAVIAGFGLSTPGSTVLVAGIGILVVTVLIMRQL
jgi:MFS family permease